MNLQKVLPCRYCRENYKKNLKAVPLTKTVLKNRENFSRWVYDLHNHINGMLGKKSKLSYEDVRDRYEHFRARCLVRKEVPTAKCSIKRKVVPNHCMVSSQNVSSILFQKILEKKF